MMPVTLADIVFPSASETPTLNSLLGDLKRASLSLGNRLQSIEADANFVTRVAKAYGRPVIANERCGSWYVDPNQKAGSAYFKSTDGHTGVWKFSSRRLNLQLLDVIQGGKGCLIIDSTRRGKRMPDALSKTIPIWTCVINRVLFPELPSYHTLYTPPKAVSASEHAQIEALIPSFVELFQSISLDVNRLQAKLSKPIKCIWVTPDSDLPGCEDDEEGGKPRVFEGAYPLILVTASKRVDGGEMGTSIGSSIALQGGRSFVYVQGAADDTENWARGLTPPIWWANKTRLLSAADSELPDLVDRVVAEYMKISNVPVSIGTLQSWKSMATEVFPGVWVGALLLGSRAENEQTPSLVRGDNNTATISITSDTTPPESWTKSPEHMVLGLGKHKTASRSLRRALPNICAFAVTWLKGAVDLETTSSSRVLLITCPTGKDLAVGAALAIQCWCFTDTGELRDIPGKEGDFTKTVIKVRIGKIMTAMPDANPNRSTLQSVNSFLMG